jgi:hypothetical protein
MWRKVEMRLACTATRFPPTPAETHRTQTQNSTCLLSVEACPLSSFRVCVDIAQSPREEQDTTRKKINTSLLPESSKLLCPHLCGDMVIPHASGEAVRVLARIWAICGS